MSTIFSAVVARSFRPQPSFLASVEERLGLAVLTFALLVASAFSLMASEAKIGDIVVDHGWSRATPAGAKVAGGFVVIHNQGSADDRLIAVETGIAERGEIHEMSVDDKGVMTMRPLADGLVIPAGETVELKPGSFHIMFIGLNAQPDEGESFPARLIFEKAGAAELMFEVTGMGGSHEGHKGHGVKKND
ncbi:copper chaperone PCu(A)C [Nitratireductor sp. CAU 1489]|uniref:Copper chaperone PCu(A)C n=1 Tax=Nitratireductor arenosus TaxID=2682096 RepID=A0A844QP17_9HYPH|nr:copper chaperone PCu(A)C [Nitratireductor arenosus]MVA99329.1 copper chaperone PCu(A)C [Nitratireductor arenosus]